jgi:hypothetical protein
MPSVLGPTGPRPVPGSTTTTSTPATDPHAATGSVTPNRGWTGGPSTRGAVDPSITAPGANPSDIQASLPNPVRTAINANIDRFNSRIETALGHDAMSMARGRTPVREGDPLSQGQLDELQNAASDFLSGMPVGALSPEVASAIEDKLRANGVHVRDISSTRLGDLGKVGGDIVKDLLKDLKQGSPAAFYGLAGAAALAAGHAAWTGGSAKLQSLGIKPEIKQKFFDGQLEVKLRGDWQAHFKDFKPSVGVTYNYNSQDFRLSTSVTANTSGLNTVGGSVVYQPHDNFRLSAGVEHNFQTDRTTASAEAAWRVRNDVDFALSASHDSRGDSRVGVGVRIRF